MTEPTGRAPRKRRPDPPEEHVLLLLGQLLEAVQHASEGVRSSSGTIAAHTVRLETAARTLKVLEQEVRELNRVVIEGDDHNPSLRHRVSDHASEIALITQEVKAISDQLTASDRRHNQAIGGGRVLFYVVIALFQLATLAVACYAALKGGTP